MISQYQVKRERESDISRTAWISSAFTFDNDIGKQITQEKLMLQGSLVLTYNDEYSRDIFNISKSRLVCGTLTVLYLSVY